MSAEPASPVTSRRAERRRLLADVSIFASLSEEDLDRLVDVTSLRRIERGETLFRRGDPGHQLYGVLSGRLKILVSGPDGKEIVFTVSEAGDVIGDIALLDSNPRSASVVALERSELLTLDRRDFRPFLERHPRVAVELAELLAARVRRLTALAEDALLLSRSGRLAHRLLHLKGQYGRETKGGVLIDLRMSQQELGEMIGMTRESVNKQLRVWTDCGLVQLDRGYITLVDPEALEDSARASLI